MTLEEALEISRMCKEDLYPPTNTIVLCQAISTIVKEKGKCREVYYIIDWLNQLYADYRE